MENHPYQSDRDAVFTANEVLRKENADLKNKLQLGTKKYVWGLIKKPLFYSFIVCMTLVMSFGIASTMEKYTSKPNKAESLTQNISPIKRKAQPSQLKDITVKFRRSTNIEIKNFKKICNEDNCFKYGELCLININYPYRTTAIGKFRNKILFRYLIINPIKQKVYDYQCPSNTLFFMSIADVEEYIKEYKEEQVWLAKIKKKKQEKLAKEKQEKEFIKRALNTP